MYQTRTGERKVGDSVGVEIAHERLVAGLPEEEHLVGDAVAQRARVPRAVAEEDQIGRAVAVDVAQERLVARRAQ